ncbi:hypothetical protein MCETE4_00066 [Acidimicrobiia bacterium]
MGSRTVGEDDSTVVATQGRRSAARLVDVGSLNDSDIVGHDSCPLRSVSSITNPSALTTA